MNKSDNKHNSNGVITASFVSTKVPSLQQQRISKFNALVTARIEHKTCSEFSLTLPWMDFGKNLSDVKFIIDAGYDVESSGDDWWVTLPKLNDKE